MSLLDPPDDPAMLALDLEAKALAPQPGTWYDPRDPLCDGRTLTQDETDCLIRAEISMRAPLSDDEVRRAVGATAYIQVPYQRPHLKPQQYLTARCQRGGIDSDPLVRVLARRLWGWRDEAWRRDRGVRVGDQVTVISDVTCALAWAHESAHLHEHDPHGRYRCTAVHDALPGQVVEVIVDDGYRSYRRLLFRVTARPRYPRPERCDSCPSCHGAGDQADMYNFSDRHPVTVRTGARCRTCYGAGFVYDEHDS